MTTSVSPADDGAGRIRRALRERACAERLALPDERRATLTEQLEAHLDSLLARLAPHVLAFCWPYRAEPDLRAWMCRWLAGGPSRVAALPVVLAKATPMVFRRWTPGMEMVFDRHGIPHPPDGEALVPDAVLVPCNAFDAAGYRLGYGGGYFDRTLALLGPVVVAVGVGFELGRAQTVYPQRHDRPMQWIVTEAGAFPARPPAS